MTVSRKNINLFLMDGEPSGRLKCSLLNWTGLGYKVPRSFLSLCSELKYFAYTGVAEPRFRRVVSHPSGKSEPALRAMSQGRCECVSLKLS